jgi:hypothetical protein
MSMKGEIRGQSEISGPVELSDEFGGGWHAIVGVTEDRRAEEERVLVEAGSTVAVAVAVAAVAVAGVGSAADWPMRLDV